MLGTCAAQVWRLYVAASTRRRHASSCMVPLARAHERRVGSFSPPVLPSKPHEELSCGGSGDVWVGPGLKIKLARAGLLGLWLEIWKCARLRISWLRLC